MTESAETSPNISGLPDVSSGNAASSDETTALPLCCEKFVEQALRDYESQLIAYATSILRDIDRARDVVQDTFIRLCQQDMAKVRANLKSWLFTVCRNRALDVLRKEQRSTPLDDIRWQKVAGPGLQPDESAEHEERLSQLMAFLDRLSANQREVILLKFQQGLSYQEIREITGLTTGNIGFLIHTGLKRLRDILPDDLK
ncbi:MAG: sigma-70 family RNA polymerase sigma factor [Luteolibacter sp.]